MMRNYRYALLPVLLLSTSVLQAQSINQFVQDAYNFSNTNAQGTARSLGFGNALGSVGADFSTIAVNPAGLGVYRSSELSFTPSLKLSGANSQYQGNTTGDNAARMNISNFGLVLTKAKKGVRYDRSNWKTFTLAFGMNRVADFNYNYNYSGKNTSSSGSQVFESAANNDTASAYVSPSSELGSIGYQSYLLERNAARQFYTIVPFEGGVNQVKTAQMNGGISEYTLAFGGNYKEKLMLGMALNLPSIRYDQLTSYSESLSADNNYANPYGFRSFDYTQSMKISGLGFNAKLGAIYKISNSFRVGASFHTPTFYAINNVFTPSIDVRSDAGMQLSVYDALVQYSTNYRLTTPWKGVLSATYIFKKIGFITADYEYVGYNTMRYRVLPDEYGYSNLDFQNALNDGIKNTYNGVSNFRIGAEGRLGKVFMLRAGFGYYGNPYKSGNDNAQRMDISGGLGFHFKHFFTDLAYVYSMYSLQQQPYYVDYATVISGPAPAVMPTATTDFNLSNIALTVGVKF